MKLNAALFLYQNRNAKPSPQRLKACLDKIRNKQLSLRRAANLYNIPLATVHRYVHKDSSLKKKRPGPIPALGIEGEKLLKNYILDMSRQGFPLTKQCLFSAVKTNLRLID